MFWHLTKGASGDRFVIFLTFMADFGRLASMTRWVSILVGAIGLVALTAVPASAQWFLGAGFGRALPPPGVGAERTFTLDLGAMSTRGWLGAEADYGVMPSLENGGEARTLSGSLLIGRKTGSGWRPYGSVGFGHLGPVNTFSDNFRLYGTTAPQKSVLTFGGGVMGDFTKHWGARADVRIFRDLTTQVAGVPAHLTFTRIAVGVYLAF